MSCHLQTYTYKTVARTYRVHRSIKFGILIPPQLLANQTTNPTSWQMASFTIGSQRPLDPLVSIAQVKGHLRLLRVFHNLRVIVEECKDRRIPALAAQLDKDSRWVWFVTLAIDRYVKLLSINVHSMTVGQDLSDGPSLCDLYLLRSSSLNNFHLSMCG
jgi:hypothetical protein